MLVSRPCTQLDTNLLLLDVGAASTGSIVELLSHRVTNFFHRVYGLCSVLPVCPVQLGCLEKLQSFQVHGQSPVHLACHFLFKQIAIDTHTQ